jgi:hypothetical protein
MEYGHSTIAIIYRSIIKAICIHMSLHYEEVLRCKWLHPWAKWKGNQNFTIWINPMQTADVS